ncbi:MAG: transporter [Sphingomonas bacterium]|nr:transporter [Sphingomonas bacterium]
MPPCRPPFGVVLLRAALFGIAAAAIPAMMPLVARDVVSGGPLTYGLLLGAFGLGAVGGALVSVPLRRRLSMEWIVRAASIALAPGAAATAGC